ncbi:ligand-binding sensor domain-containing protein [Thalassobellus suaedae]|uniref:Two-component regulator propeller domain-containing protein n=1 Tax=Thalassobellus suaedae TaxID=3074124 RepID=A0ABY9XQF4_9FLAO|nr:two-component regulator propeller domain-containing protein [Flavobacteriaceae bacterium HL-DH14]
MNFIFSMVDFKRLACYVLFLMTFHCVFAQNNILKDTLYGQYLGQQKGLVQLNIKGMSIDDLGYLWVGTEDGLHKFNSYEFKVYLHDPNDSTSIKDDHIRGLHFTNDTLWIATNTKGISGFVPSKNKFFNLNLSKSNHELDTSYRIFELTNDFLLFSVKNHIIIFDRKHKTHQIIPLPKNKKELYITDVTQIDKNKFWLGSSAAGILSLNTDTFKISETSLLIDKNRICFYNLANITFIGTNDGLYSYNFKTSQLSTTSVALDINCISPFKSNNLYLGTKNGLYKYNYLSQSLTSITCVTQENNTFVTFDVNNIIHDKKGNLWIGTEADGLLHFNMYQKKFNTIKLSLDEFPLKNNISSFQFLKGKDSTLWIGSKFGVVRYSHIKKQFKLYQSKGHPLIYALTKDKNHNIWAGGFTTGLLKYNLKKDIFEKIRPQKSKLQDEDIIEIISIDANTLWVCTWSGGIYKYDINSEKFEEVLINGSQINRARTSLVDSHGNIWLGSDEGVCKISKDNKITRYSATDAPDRKLSSNRIFSIKEDFFGNIWFGTNSGLTKLNTKTDKTTLYYKQKGLPNDFIYAILISEKNNIWVSTNYGLSVLNTKTNLFTNYTISDGLQNNEFNGKAGFKDEYGNFYFGGVSGINVFNPEKITTNPYLPNVYIESVELFNKLINKNVLYHKNLEFKSYENVITLNFAGINYLNPEKCVYKYKMEGFDNSWRPTTKNRSTTYTNLDPGEYAFKVKGSNDVGIWNEIPTTIKITITPPWYNSTLLRVFIGLFIILSIILFYFYKTTKLRRDKLNLERIITDRTREIQSKNKDLEQAYIESDKQRKNISFLMRELSHRVKNNLQIISSLLNIQANNLEDKVSKNALKVAKNRILTISQIENKIPKEDESIEINTFIRNISDSIISALSDDANLKFNVEYHLDSKITLNNINITLIGLILNELITNSTKYAFKSFKENNTLKISTIVKDNHFILSIEDTGKGYDSKKLKGNKSLGLELIQDMVDQLNGTLTINSTNGTKNTIKIPI